KLRRLHQYFCAVRGHAPYPAVRCNAPEFSAVVGATGGVHPCFFIEGPAGAVASSGADLTEILNAPEMRTLRGAIRSGRRPECKTCVCTLYRAPQTSAGQAATRPAEHAA